VRGLAEQVLAELDVKVAAAGSCPLPAPCRCAGSSSSAAWSVDRSPGRYPWTCPPRPCVSGLLSRSARNTWRSDRIETSPRTAYAQVRRHVTRGGGRRSVKPSAQPTLVRTQHLPLPAETARWLRILVAGGPFFFLSRRVSPCVAADRCVAVSRSHGGRVLCPGTAGAHRRLFHGRPRTGRGGSAFPGSNAETGGFQLVPRLRHRQPPRSAEHREELPRVQA
jgi:hypothetical protein